MKGAGELDTPRCGSGSRMTPSMCGSLPAFGAPAGGACLSAARLRPCGSLLPLDGTCFTFNRRLLVSRRLLRSFRMGMAGRMRRLGDSAATRKHHRSNQQKTNDNRHGSSGVNPQNHHLVLIPDHVSTLSRAESLRAPPQLRAESRQVRHIEQVIYFQ